MQVELLTEWRNKLNPKICAIPGVNGLRVNGTSLLVEVEKNTEPVNNAIMDLLEKEGADLIPYSVKVVGRVVKI
jgi:hypothetical protein